MHVNRDARKGVLCCVFFLPLQVKKTQREDIAGREIDELGDTDARRINFETDQPPSGFIAHQ